MTAMAQRDLGKGLGLFCYCKTFTVLSRSGKVPFERGFG